MPATTLSLTIEIPELGVGSSWSSFESLAVAMSTQLPVQALAEALDDGQERLVDSVCGPRWSPMRHLSAPFACPGCGSDADFARKGRRSRPRKLGTAAGVVQLRLWHVGCRDCGRVFAPLLVMLGLVGKRRSDRLMVDLGELASQVSFARAGRLSAQLAGTGATGGQAHHATADLAALLQGQPGGDEPAEPHGEHRDGEHRDSEDRDGPGAGGAGGAGLTGAGGGGLGPGHPAPEAVLLDGTGVRAGNRRLGTGAHLALGLTGRSGPASRRRAHRHLLGLTVGEDWAALGAQLAGLPTPAVVVVDGEPEVTALAQRLWPAAPIQRCWWHLPHGLRKAFYADDAANRHVNPRWARTMSDELGELLREAARAEDTPEQALERFDAFVARFPTGLTSAHTYLAAARPHTFTGLDPDLRARLAHLGGPELGTGVLERLMRELNARTDIGGARWSIAGLRDLLTVQTARLLNHPAWKEIHRATHPTNKIPFRLQKFNAC